MRTMAGLAWWRGDNPTAQGVLHQGRRHHNSDKRTAMRVMLLAFATVFIISFAANAILMAAGFSSQAMHSGPDVRLNASDD